jgi:hypothetical protein
MDGGFILSLFVWGAVAILVIAVGFNAFRRKGSSHVRRRPGPGAIGTVYGMLNEDKQRAIEIVVEGRAEETDPEHADGTPKAGT